MFRFSGQNRLSYPVISVTAPSLLDWVLACGHCWPAVSAAGSVFRPLPFSIPPLPLNFNREEEAAGVLGRPE